MNHKKLLLSIVLALPLIAAAGVNIENGDFHITYTDIESKSPDHNLILSRTYNSLTTDSGWFGYGWGSPYETRLTVMPDLTVAVRLNGTGRLIYFRPSGGSSPRIATGVIVSTATARDGLDPEKAAKLHDALLKDENLRLEKTRRYNIGTQLPPQAVAHSGECPQSVVRRENDGYTRTDCNGNTEQFDLDGRLLRREDRHGYAYSVNYTGERPDSISDSFGQRIALLWSTEGRIVEATGGGNTVWYEYDPKDNLTTARYSNGLHYQYDYDTHHNLTRIGYADNSSMQIAYSAEKIGYVTSVTERSGDQTIYEYGTDPSDPRRHLITVTQKPASSTSQTRSYAFRRSVTATGEEIVSEVAEGTGVARRERAYDDNNRLVRMTTADGYAHYIYHPRTKKLILMLAADGRKEFHYDDNGELVLARTSDGRSVELQYDKAGKIRKMIDVDLASKTRRELGFTYNTAGKPTEITLAGVGKIKVDYGSNGEIEKVSSRGGAKMALLVTKAFQDLLGIVNVAGVKIGM